MTKKLLITVLAVMACTASFCQQENEFTEVVIADTVNFDANEIIFALVVQPDIGCSEFEDGNTIAHGKNTKAGSTTGKSAVQPHAITRINKVITAQRIDTLSFPQYAIAKDAYTGQTQKIFFLHFSSADQLAAFIRGINDIDKIYGYIVSKKSSLTDHYKELLTKKILEKAFIDASYISLQSKKTIGKLLRVTEEPIEASAAGGWTSYPPLSALTGANYAGDKAQITMERKLRVRYAWQ